MNTHAPTRPAHSTSPAEARAALIIEHLQELEPIELLEIEQILHGAQHRATSYGAECTLMKLAYLVGAVRQSLSYQHRRIRQ